MTAILTPEVAAQLATTQEGRHLTPARLDAAINLIFDAHGGLKLAVWHRDYGLDADFLARCVDKYRVDALSNLRAAVAILETGPLDGRAAVTADADGFAKERA